MKPDYGALLYSQGISSEQRIVFYDVPVSHITLTDVPCLTTLVNRIEDGVEYALSFDFSDDAAAHLLARCPESVLAALDRAVSAVQPGERTIDIAPPITLTLDASLGPLQRSPREVFAPLLVHRID